MRKIGNTLLAVGVMTFVLPALWVPTDPSAWPIEPDGWWMATGAVLVVIGWVMTGSRKKA